MAEEKNKVDLEDSRKVAENIYNPEKENKNSAEKGMAETNEQVKKHLSDGTVDRQTDDE